jgi:hypothetical protein
METIFLGVMMSGFVFVVSIDTIRKREKYLKTGK